MVEEDGEIRKILYLLTLSKRLFCVTATTVLTKEKYKKYQGLSVKLLFFP